MGYTINIIHKRKVYMLPIYIYIYVKQKVKQKPTQINISTYQEVFSIITLLSKKYVYPNMPKDIYLSTYMTKLK